jgi:hypothetical protein
VAYRWADGGDLTVQGLEFLKAPLHIVPGTQVELHPELVEQSGLFGIVGGLGCLQTGDRAGSPQP